MAMPLFSAREQAVARRQNVERWCICRQCVYGFAISVEIDEWGGGHRVCGEPCVVGIPRMSADDCNDDDGAAAIVDAAAVVTMVVSFSDPPPSAPPSVLRCNICRVEVDPPPSSSSFSDPCVSDDNDTISADN
jgi:hypothetical protein